MTRLLNKIDIAVAEGGVRRGIDEAVDVRAKMIATVGWKLEEGYEEEGYKEEDLKLCEETEPIIREKAEYFKRGARTRARSTNSTLASSTATSRGAA